MKTNNTIKLSLLTFMLLLAGCKGKIVSNHIASQTEIASRVNQITTIPSDCISWFDGCNTCSVSKEKITDCTKKICSVVMLGEPTCLQYKITSAASTTEEIIFKIGPKKINCKNSVLQNCLVVNGELFYSEINGFYFEPGFEYKIRVKKTLKNSLSSSISSQNKPPEYIYDLLEIISKLKK